jgi:hypothetical protein
MSGNRHPKRGRGAIQRDIALRREALSGTRLPKPTVKIVMGRGAMQRDIALRREAFEAQSKRLDTLRTTNERPAARLAARGRR